MKRIGFAVVVLTVLALSSTARAQSTNLRAFLTGDEEVPPISSAATGLFLARMASDGSISFTMTYEGLAADATVSHIHFGPDRVAGGVMIFLCGGGNQPACPAGKAGVIQGTITEANVVGPTAQGIQPMELEKALQAVLDGLGYVNIHNATFPAGEIRGQVKALNRRFKS
jgi:hypothetical protein